MRIAKSMLADLMRLLIQMVPLYSSLVYFLNHLLWLRWSLHAHCWIHVRC